MNYAFENYKGNSFLNGMDNSEEMQMNCDYYFAQQTEKPYYSPFYDEIAYDKSWDRALLKRKEKIGHELIYERHDKMIIEGNNEFYDFKKIADTSFKSHNPVEVEVELHFESVPKPFRAFFVMSMQNSKGDVVCYKRALLNWLSDDLNGQTKHIKLTSGNLPDTVKEFNIHIWNIEKKEIKIQLEDMKLYRLTGKGVDFKIPENYYPRIQRVIGRTLL